MGASITLAGESLIAQKQAAQQPLNVKRFIFANVPGLDPTGAVDRAAGKPAANRIVYTAEIPNGNAGFVNPNQVVYSLQVGSDIGDWDFNWIGLESAESVLFAVAYVPLQQKRRNIPPLQVGNNITRNFLVAFDGAQALTGISIDASTWQHDFTVRLAGIDERERLSNRDLYGRKLFFGSSLQVEKVGSQYQLKPGTGYVEGIRVYSAAMQVLTPPAAPTTAWLDVSLQRDLNDVKTTWSVVYFQQGSQELDYIDSAGVQHYRVAIADLVNADSILDRRTVEPIDGPVVQMFAARTGDYQYLRARATTKDDVGLGNVPNAVSDDPETNSSVILATTKAVKAVTTAIWLAIDKIVSGVTVVGKAAALSTARKITLSGAITGNAQFDGTGDITLLTAAAAASENAAGAAKVATQVQVDTGTDDTAYVTPKKLRWGMVKGANYIIFPSWMFSLKLVWGRVENVLLNQTFYPVTFPIAFSSQVIHIGAEINRETVISGTVAVLIKPSFTLTGFEIAGDQDTNSSYGDLPWFAIGI